MAYATQADVEKILPEGESVPTEAVPRLTVNLDEATDCVVSFLGFEYVDFTADDDADPDLPANGFQRVGTTGVISDDVLGAIPGAVIRVTARCALRGFIDEPDNPGAQSTTSLMGPFNHIINWSKHATDRDFYLTDSEKERLIRFRLEYTPGAAHQPMYGIEDPVGHWAYAGGRWGQYGYGRYGYGRGYPGGW